MKKISLKCSTFKTVYVYLRPKRREIKNVTHPRGNVDRKEDPSKQNKQKTQPEMEKVPLLVFVIICDVIREWPALCHGLL